MRRVLLAVALAIFSLPASADWSIGMAYPFDDGFVMTATDSWTTTLADSTPLDTRRCSSVTASFDPSTGDTSTDATALLFSCPSATSTRSQCRRLIELPQDGTARQVNVGGGYLMSVPATITAGGDTAQVFVTCDARGALSKCMDAPASNGTGDDAVYFIPPSSGRSVLALLCVADSGGSGTAYLESRSALTPTTTGTAMMSSMACDDSGGISQDITSPSLAGNMIGTLRISASSGSLRVVAYCQR